MRTDFDAPVAPRSPLIGVVRLAGMATDAGERGFVDVVLDRADVEIFDAVGWVGVVEQIRKLDHSGWYDLVIVLDAATEQQGRDLATACLANGATGIASSHDARRGAATTYQPVGAAH